MINIVVRTILGMEKYLNGYKSQIIKIPEDYDVGDLMKYLVNMFGKDFEDAMFDKEGNLKKGIFLMVNGINIFAKEGFEMKLKDGDRFLIFPPVAGG